MLLPVGALLAGSLLGGGEDAGGFDEEFDEAVQEQVPVEGVFVVRDRGYEGDDQFPGPAGFGGAFAEVEVFPQDRVVFFVKYTDNNCVLDGP